MGVVTLVALQSPLPMAQLQVAEQEGVALCFCDFVALGSVYVSRAIVWSH